MITVEQIAKAYANTGIQPITGRFFPISQEPNVRRCCAAGAVAIDRKQTWTQLVEAHGETFLVGLMQGFDGIRTHAIQEPKDTDDPYAIGLRIGREAAQALQPMIG